MKIPRDPEGYSVSNGVVHTRYASHSGKAGSRVRTVAGALALLDNQKAKVCRLCFPVDSTEDTKPKGIQQRRVSGKMEAEKAPRD